MSTATNAQPAKERPLFTQQLCAEPGVDAIRALRAALKSMLRKYGLRCVSVHEGNGDERRNAF
jgi:hypothetical protein